MKSLTTQNTRLTHVILFDRVDLKCNLAYYFVGIKLKIKNKTSLALPTSALRITMCE